MRPKMNKQINEIEIRTALKGSRHPQSAKDVLTKHGWNILGRGIEALVAAHPKKPYVLKLFPKNSEYRWFVQYCQTNPNNPYLPKFSRYVRPVPGTGYSYVRMEKLQHISDSTLIKSFAPYLCVLHELFDDRSDDIFWNLGYDHAAFAGIVHNIYDDQEACAADAPPAWISTVQDLIRIMQQHNLTQFDLHSENVMLRGNQLVITDPFV
jgi:hypothetical protein